MPQPHAESCRISMPLRMHSRACMHACMHSMLCSHMAYNCREYPPQLPQRQAIFQSDLSRAGRPRRDCSTVSHGCKDLLSSGHHELYLEQQVKLYSKARVHQLLARPGKGCQGALSQGLGHDQARCIGTDEHASVSSRFLNLRATAALCNTSHERNES